MNKLFLLVIINCLLAISASKLKAQILKIDGKCFNKCLEIFIKKNICVTPEACVYLHNKSKSFDKTYIKLQKIRPKIAKEISDSDFLIKYPGKIFADKFNINLCKK